MYRSYGTYLMYRIEAILKEADESLTVIQITSLIEADCDYTKSERKSLKSRVRCALIKLETENIARRTPQIGEKNLITFKWQINESVRCKS